MITHAKKQGLVVVGGGPAGLAPLFAMASVGRLREVLDLGVTILERGEVLGAGALGSYAIRSDSSAETLVDIVMRSQEPVLANLRAHPVTQTLAQFGKDAAPLSLAGLFLELAGTALCEAVATSRWGRVITGATAVCVRRDAGGTWRTRFVDASQQTQEVLSTNVVLATGAHQPIDRLLSEEVAGEALLPEFNARLMQSGQFLAKGGFEKAARLLGGAHTPKVAIVGGSTSAAAVALAVLSKLPSVDFEENAVTLLHRKPLRIFYETPQDAVAEGYTEFTPDDICPLTGRVYRLSGFRLDSRELIMKARNIGGRPAEPRLKLLKLNGGTQAEARQILHGADLIIAALGYRPRLLPVFDARMQPISLLTPDATRWAVVDQSCRVLTADEQPLAGLFAVGLAVGPAASRQFGGEKGFQGQVNSLWVWQHTLGQIIADQVLARSRERAIQQTPVNWPSSKQSGRTLNALGGALAAKTAGVR